MMKEIFELFERALKDNSEQGVVAIIDKDNCAFSCYHNYDTKGNNIFSFSVDNNIKCDLSNKPVEIHNNKKANYLYSSQCKYNGKQKKVSFILKGTIKSVYGYKGKISFAIVPEHIVIWLNEERILDCSFEDFQKYLAEKENSQTVQKNR